VPLPRKVVYRLDKPRIFRSPCQNSCHSLIDKLLLLEVEKAINLFVLVQFVLFGVELVRMPFGLRFVPRLT
jgi:hypothetical protein